MKRSNVLCEGRFRFGSFWRWVGAWFGKLDLAVAAVENLRHPCCDDDSPRQIAGEHDLGEALQGLVIKAVEEFVDEEQAGSLDERPGDRK